MANCRYCGTDCPEQGEHDRFFDCALYTERQPTNADRIRGMRDEELAELLLDGCRGSNCDAQPQNEFGSVDCLKCRLNWLKQPADK